MEKVVSSVHQFSSANPKVRLIVKTKGTTRVGRVTIELFENLVPKTVDNFRSLCTGECGVGSTGKPLTYKLSTFHKVIPGFFIQGGDIIQNNGTSGYSIYGSTFPDENLSMNFDEPGLVAMANSGPNTNNSQFFITLAPLPWLNGKNVIFGKVIKGMQYLQGLQYSCRPNSATGQPKKKIIIDKCTVLKKE